MITLVKCLVYPETNLGKNKDKLRYHPLTDYFPDPILLDDFRTSESPFDVLRQTLQGHYLQSYLGIKPWIVNVSKGRGYLDISEIEGKRVDGTIQDLINHGGFPVAIRPHRLNYQETKDLVGQIMSGLDPKNIFGVFVSRKERLSSRAYSDVLRALGRMVSEEQVEQMFSKQYENLHNYETAQRQREAEAWSSLAHQVFGGEVV